MRHTKLTRRSIRHSASAGENSKTAGDRTQRARIELCRLIRANRETAPPRIAGFASLLSIESRQPAALSWTARIIDWREVHRKKSRLKD